MQLLFVGLLAAPPDGRRNVFDQTVEIQWLDHAYVFGVVTLRDAAVLRAQRRGLLPDGLLLEIKIDEHGHLAAQALGFEGPHQKIGGAPGIAIQHRGHVEANRAIVTASKISGEDLKATPLWEAISHVVVCRAQPAWNDRRHDQEKLLEGHPQDTKSALAENESVKIEKLVRQGKRQLGTDRRKRKRPHLPSVAGAVKFPPNCWRR
jgi:hypothetical protein